MAVSAQLVRELREKTGAGIMDCKKALVKAEGDIKKAIEYLREMGLASAHKKRVRITREGMIGSYIHAGGKIGVLIEVNCETDFVARNKEFKDLVKDLCMQIAASNPSYLSSENVPDEVRAKERDIYRKQSLKSGKPEKVIDRIVEGKMEKFYSEVCLLKQTFIKDSSINVDEYIKTKIAKFGENIVVKRFVRYQLGET